MRIAFLTLLLSAFLPIDAGFAASRERQGYFFELNSGELKAELAEARANGKRALLVMFEQEGCPACLYMKRSVLSRADVQAYFRQHFASIAVDIYSSVPLVDFAGRDMTEKSYAQALKIRGTPTFIFYDLDGAEITRVIGALKPPEFMLLGEYVAGGTYKTRSFADVKRDKAVARREKTF